MQIIENEEQEFFILQIFGDIDAASSIALDKALEKTIAQNKKNILIDCTNLKYISSAGLGVFMSYIQAFEEKSILFALFGLSEKVKNVFQILGLDELLQIVDSKNDAKLLKNDSLL